ncbi:vicilin-like seed storage protein At2g18540 [Pollicipes pollicipes]|uniref:vicilin-like seed storage protein At2g18540 n=1 Tax=Pollicipes pollicipes TaxID=41117 RepID=UPI0018855884|nr:vicilin-like seed storage protein At2g18540 [Pollicipes pollicipes]
MARRINEQRAEILARSRRRSEAACDHLWSLIGNKISDEDARIAAIVAQKRAQKDAEEAAKQAARAAMMASITQHRIDEVRRHRDGERRDAERKLEERAALDDETRRLAAELRDRQRDLLEQRSRNRRDWQEQAEEVEAKRLVEKEEEYEEVNQLKGTIRKEKEQFEEYVRTEMERLEQGKRNTFPLQVAARAPAPGFLRHSTDWSSVGIRPY